MTFKVGDKVRYTHDDCYGSLQKGSIFTVAKVRESSEAGKFLVHLEEVQYGETGYWDWKFELVKPEVTFKVGDNVKCIDAGQNIYLTTGGSYIVIGVGSPDNDGHYLVKVKNISEDLGYYWDYRFELVKPEAAATPQLPEVPQEIVDYLQDYYKNNSTVSHHIVEVQRLLEKVYGVKTNVAEQKTVVITFEKV